MSFLIALLATSIWFPPQYYINESTLIAIVNIGSIHEAKTPEMVVVHSAEATIEKLIYQKPECEIKLPDKIIIYQIDPNGHIGTDDGYGHPILKTGRCFVMLKEQGENKFIPYDTLSLQEINKWGICWPTTNIKRESFSEAQIIEKINKLIKK